MSYCQPNLINAQNPGTNIPRDRKLNTTFNLTIEVIHARTIRIFDIIENYFNVILSLQLFGKID
jgi:hypothetical protein